MQSLFSPSFNNCCNGSMKQDLDPKARLPDSVDRVKVYWHDEAAEGRQQWHLATKSKCVKTGRQKSKKADEGQNTAGGRQSRKAVARMVRYDGYKATTGGSENQVCGTDGNTVRAEKHANINNWHQHRDNYADNETKPVSICLIQLSRRPWLIDGRIALFVWFNIK